MDIPDLCSFSSRFDKWFGEKAWYDHVDAYNDIRYLFAADFAKVKITIKDDAFIECDDDDEDTEDTLEVYESKFCKAHCHGLFDPLPFCNYDDFFMKKRLQSTVYRSKCIMSVSCCAALYCAECLPDPEDDDNFKCLNCEAVIIKNSSSVLNIDFYIAKYDYERQNIQDQHELKKAFYRYDVEADSTSVSSLQNLCKDEIRWQLVKKYNIATKKAICPYVDKLPLSIPMKENLKNEPNLIRYYQPGENLMKYVERIRTVGQLTICTIFTEFGFGGIKYFCDDEWYINTYTKAYFSLPEPENILACYSRDEAKKRVLLIKKVHQLLTKNGDSDGDSDSDEDQEDSDGDSDSDEDQEDDYQ